MQSVPNQKWLCLLGLAEEILWFLQAHPNASERDAQGNIIFAADLRAIQEGKIATIEKAAP
jgi:hypothetical protein